MSNTRPDSNPGSKPNPSEWLTVAEAVHVHFQHTPREKPIHRSSVYRWVDDPEHPVKGDRFAGELFVERASLETFCREGRRRRPGRGRGRRHATPADAAHAEAALARIRSKHGIAPKTQGGDTE